MLFTQKRNKLCVTHIRKHTIKNEAAQKKSKDNNECETYAMYSVKAYSHFVIQPSSFIFRLKRFARFFLSSLTQYHGV